MKGPWSDIPSIKQASQAVRPWCVSAAGCVWGCGQGCHLCWSQRSHAPVQPTPVRRPAGQHAGAEQEGWHRTVIKPVCSHECCVSRHEDSLKLSWGDAKRRCAELGHVCRHCRGSSTMAVLIIDRGLHSLRVNNV